jgi:hypothetical protein
VTLDVNTVRFEQTPSRCPYCHGPCEDSEEVVACRACVARHHAECWRQLGRCSSCGATRFLGEAPVAPPALPDTQFYEERLQGHVDISSPSQQRLFRFLGLPVSVALALLGFGLLCETIGDLRLAAVTTPDQRSEAMSHAFGIGVLGIVAAAFGVFLGVRCAMGLLRPPPSMPGKGDDASPGLSSDPP